LIGFWKAKRRIVGCGACRVGVTLRIGARDD
jgi:hypothetical protein